MSPPRCSRRVQFVNPALTLRRTLNRDGKAKVKVNLYVFARLQPARNPSQFKGFRRSLDPARAFPRATPSAQARNLSGFENNKRNTAKADESQAAHYPTTHDNYPTHSGALRITPREAAGPWGARTAGRRAGA